MSDTNSQALIDTLDLEPIKFKLGRDEGYTASEIAAVDKWYRRFLILASKYPDRALVIPAAVDAMWHHHILDTRKYESDCKAIFGATLHHFPYFGMRGEDDARALRLAFEATNALMQEEFGEDAASDLAKLRVEWADEEAASSCSDCSGNTGPFAITPIGDARPGY